jgi:hypothetical protein
MAGQVTELAIAGTHPGDFMIDPHHDGCTGQTLDIGQECIVRLRFTPQAAGPRSALLSVATDTPAGTVTSALQGAGTIQPLAIVSPTGFDYGEVLVGRFSGLQKFVVRNGGNDSLELGSMSIGGDDAGQFVLSQDGCSGQALAPNATCAMKVRFVPTAPGALAASLVVPSNAPSSPATTPLTGVGLARPSAIINPPAFAFATTATGRYTSLQKFTLKNTGNADLHVTSVDITGADAGHFALSAASDGCTGRTVAPNATCSVKARFAPAGAGSKTAALTISNSDGVPGAESTLTGVGT